MEWLLVLVGGGGAAIWGRSWLRDRRAERRDRAQELARVVQLCEEDVTLLGEQLRRLDEETAGHPLDAAVRLDYQTALDAYESAQRTVRHLTDVEQVSTVTDTLSSGRYALACVQARLRGEPRPEKRVPCFFDPQHGPSVVDVMFTPPGRGTRRVPACARDAERVRAGEEPEIRQVVINGRRTAYYEAGAAMAPYAAGYFLSASDVQSMFVPEGHRRFGTGAV